MEVRLSREARRAMVGRVVQGGGRGEVDQGGQGQQGALLQGRSKGSDWCLAGLGRKWFRLTLNF